MPNKSIDFTGEFFVPGNSNKRIAQDHEERYKFASSYVQNKIILDIACGVGYGSQLLAESGAKKVYGVDISKKLINYAQNNNKNKKVNFRVGDLTTYKSKIKFDVVVCLETIEHVKNDEKALVNLFKLLKKDGVLIISTPNRQITSPQAKNLENKPANKFHIREYTKTELEEKLNQSGFKKLGYFGQRLQPNFLLKLFSLVDFAKRSNSKVFRVLPFLMPRYFVFVVGK